MASQHGWTLADVLDENVDNGRIHKASGGATLANRPKLALAIEHIEAGNAHILAAENFDRLFRNLDVQRQVVERIEAAGGEVWERSGRISHQRAADKFTATIKGASAEYVKDTAEERSFDAVELSIAKGIVPWHQTAPGYKQKWQDKHRVGPLTPDPRLSSVIQTAFQMRDEGTPIMTVRAYLREHGIERSYHGVMTLMRDRIYIGQIHFGSHTPNLAAHDPIVDPALFNRVQLRRQAHQLRGRRAKSDRLLARLGVLRCATCGARMVIGTQTQNGRKYPFYRCPPNGDCPRRVTVGAVMVEQVVIETIQLAIASVEGDYTIWDQKIANARQLTLDLANAERQLDAAMDQMRDWTDNRATLKLAELRQAVDDAQKRVDNSTALGGIDPYLYVAKWEDLTLAQQREVIRHLIESVTVAPGRGTSRINVTLATD